VSGSEQLRIETGEAVISVSRGGGGPGLLLLHGFPQTQLMWRMRAWFDRWLRSPAP
jgi:hypothetical protein